MQDFETVELTEDALLDLEKLDKSIQILAFKKLKQLDKNHGLGKKLGNFGNRDLSHFYKLYFNDNRYRIIYSLENEKVTIEGVQEFESNQEDQEFARVVAIGKRDKYEVYNDAFNRYFKEENGEIYH